MMTDQTVDEALERLDAVIRDYPDPDSLEPYTAEWLGYRSLLHQQARLLAERETSAGLDELELLLDGGSVTDHEIDSTFFGELLVTFQRAVLSSAQIILEGGESEGGNFSNEVRELAELKLGVPVPGSFVVPLRAPRRAEQPELGEELMSAPVADEAIEMVLSLLDSEASPASADRLVEAAGRAGSRTVNHVLQLVHRLQLTDTGLRITHRPPLSPEPRVVAIRPSSARFIESVLRLTTQRRETVHVEGRLVGASWIRRTFELEVIGQDGEPEILRGTVPTSLRREVSNSFDLPASATLEAVYTQHPSGQQKVSYTLVGIVSERTETLPFIDEA